MDSVLQELLQRINAYVGNLINTSDMPADDREALKDALLTAEVILARNAQKELRDFVAGVTAAIVSRF